MDEHGTRPLQKLLEKIHPLTHERSAKLSRMVSQNIFELSVNIHGNHVVQTCLDIMTKEEHKDPIYETIIRNSLKIALDKQGCCVMQKCLKTGSFMQQSRLINEVVNNVRELVNDEFANYVVSEVIFFKDQSINREIAKVICTNLSLYCNSKYASSVVEKLLESSNYDNQQIVFDGLVNKKKEKTKKNILKEIMLNEFGNYTIQTIMQKAIYHPNKKYIDYFLKVFRDHTEELQRVRFGKKFIAKIEHLVAEVHEKQRRASTHPLPTGFVQTNQAATGLRQLNSQQDANQHLPKCLGQCSVVSASEESASNP